MNCPNCGQVARGRFCTNCGTRLIDQERVRTQPAQEEVGGPSITVPQVAEPESEQPAVPSSAEISPLEKGQDSEVPSPVVDESSLEVQRALDAVTQPSITPNAEPMALGQIVSTTFAILRGRFGQFLGVAVAYAAAMFVGMAAFVLFAAAALGSLLTGGAGSVVGLALGGIALVAIAVVASAVMACAYINIARGDEPFDPADAIGSTMATLERAWRESPNVVMAFVALLGIWLAIGVGFGLLSALAGSVSPSPVALVDLGSLIVAVCLGASLAFVPQAAAIDHARGITALSRSMQIVVGNWWRACGYLVVVALIGAAAAIALGLLTVILSTIPLLGGLITALLIAGIAAISYAFFITYATLVFFDLKARERAAVSQQVSAVSQ